MQINTNNSDVNRSITASNFEGKYKKALKEMKNVLIVNKELMNKIEWMKKNMMDKDQFSSMIE
jgi:hypothetical protein